MSLHDLSPTFEQEFLEYEFAPLVSLGIAIARLVRKWRDHDHANATFTDAHPRFTRLPARPTTAGYGS